MYLMQNLIEQHVGEISLSIVLIFPNAAYIGIRLSKDQLKSFSI